MNICFLVLFDPDVLCIVDIKMICFRAKFDEYVIWNLGFCFNDFRFLLTKMMSYISERGI